MARTGRPKRPSVLEPPPEGFRAHEGRRRLGKRGLQGRLPRRCRHAGRVAAEGGDADAREALLARLTAPPPPSSTACRYGIPAASLAAATAACRQNCGCRSEQRRDAASEYEEHERRSREDSVLPRLRERPRQRDQRAEDRADRGLKRPPPTKTKASEGANATAAASSPPTMPRPRSPRGDGVHSSPLRPFRPWR